MESKIIITVKGKEILNKNLPRMEIEEYERECKEWGSKVARNNLLISLTKRYVGAKRIILSYIKRK